MYIHNILFTMHCTHRIPCRTVHYQQEGCVGVAIIMTHNGLMLPRPLIIIYIIIIHLYLMQASSEATQQRDGELGHVAILFTLFWQHDHTCMYTLQQNDNHFLSRQLRSSHASERFKTRDTRCPRVL